MSEPSSTAVLLVICGALLALAVLFSRPAGRAGLPVALLFIAIGVASGSEGLGGIPFEDYHLSFRVGTVALVLILFDGGLNTSYSAVRRALRPGVLLATAGVVGTAGLMALAARLLGFGWTEALLLGAIVSSTDAATVFAVLRGSGLRLKERVGATLELESGLNDPVAVILTIALTQALAGGEGLRWRLVADSALQLAVGAGLGAGIGFTGRRLLRWLRLPASGLYPVFTVALACLAFGVPTLFYGSGFLAVYVAAVLIGHEAIGYRSGVLRVHDALAWISQALLFVMLGLLIFPSRLIAAGWTGLALGLVLAFVARPLVVAGCLAPFRYPWREVGYVGWVGLRGAVPIVLATFPVMAHAPGAQEIFDVVFVVVVVNALIPGATVRWLTRRLRLVNELSPAPPAVVEINSAEPLGGELRSYFVRRESAVAGAAVADLPFPPAASALLVARGKELIVPKGPTTLQPGDHVYVFCAHDDLPFMDLMFGHAEES